MSDYRYTDQRFDEDVTLTIAEHFAYACVVASGERHVHVPGAERRAAAQALAGDLYEVVPVPAVPADDDPINPSDVKIGDLVEYERRPGYKPCRVLGEVEDVLDGGRSIQLHDKWWNTAPGMATVRPVRRAEPEPDPEQVEALAVLLSNWGPQHSTEGFARELARRGVRVGEQP